MPVTARLSKKFYERLGDEVTNELVEWFNSVDAAYRNEFRDLFEAHFGRFEARLQQGLAELRAEFQQALAVQQRDLADLRGELRAGLAELRGELRAEFKADLGALGTRLILWSFGFWVANIVTVLTILKLARVL
jgi:hypothetical protein